MPDRRRVQRRSARQRGNNTDPYAGSSQGCGPDVLAEPIPVPTPAVERLPVAVIVVGAMSITILEHADTVDDEHDAEGRVVLVSADPGDNIVAYGCRRVRIVNGYNQASAIPARAIIVLQDIGEP